MKTHACSLMFQGPGLKENSNPPSHRGALYVVIGRMKAKNLPRGCAVRVTTLVDIMGAGARKLKKRFAELEVHSPMVGHDLSFVQLLHKTNKALTLLPAPVAVLSPTFAVSGTASRDRLYSIPMRELLGRGCLRLHPPRSRTPSFCGGHVSRKIKQGRDKEGRGKEDI